MARITTAFIYLAICGICVFLTSRIPSYSFAGSQTFEKKKIQYFSFFLPILVFTLFWGLRYDVGTDYLEYKALYESYDVMDSSHGEWGYLATNYFFKLLGFPYYSIFLYTSFVFVFSVYFCCSQENRLFATLAVFFFMTGPVLFAQNGTRQMLSISFFLIGLVFLGKRQFLPWLLLIAVATLNHRSVLVPAAIMSILYFIKPIHINKYFLVALNIALFVFGASFQSLFINNMEEVAILLTYDNYIEGALERVNSQLDYNTGIGKYLLFFVNSTVFLSQDLFIKKERNMRYYLYWCFIIASNLVPLFWGNETLGRLAVSFTSIAWASYALALAALIKKKDTFLTSVVLAIIVWEILSFFISVNANSNGCGSYQMISLF